MEVDHGEAFDTFVDGPPTNITVPPFSGRATVWWAHQGTMNGLKQMALDVLGSPCESG